MKSCVKIDSNSEQKFGCWFCSSFKAGALKPFQRGALSQEVTALHCSRACPGLNSEQGGVRSSPALPAAPAVGTGECCLRSLARHRSRQHWKGQVPSQGAAGLLAAAWMPRPGRSEVVRLCLVSCRGNFWSDCDFCASAKCLCRGCKSSVSEDG